ncbi:unnamed protein product [Aureobasidium mustum]|uniref:GPI anchored cell wall protein n=1 Tax=Aureobasidium mustum TaxID=2773714 RepID=A0A9N8PAU5_9PEZI|nr:unnamed protein product [Aureobasidium mustum]
MFFKISIVFAVFALLIQVAVSAPPACVLQAVNQAGNPPSDVKDICASGSTVEQTLVSDCGNNFDAAMSAFSSICSGVGVTISIWSAASSSATPVSSNAISTSATSITMATSDDKSDSTSTSTSAPAPASSTESMVESTDVAVTTATGILTATDTVTTTQPAGSSGVSVSSSTVSTGAAEHVEKNGWVMGAMAAAGLVMAL